MGIERFVFRREECLDDLFGHRLYRHEDPLLARELRHQAAISGVYPRHHRRIVIGQLLIFGQAFAEMIKTEKHRACTGNHQHNQHKEYRRKNSHITLSGPTRQYHPPRRQKVRTRPTILQL